ncbi:hypothetical protein [Psychroserpens mesophilus]|uniref:hypothetical protein n=1 Tax=Psychroserpens mesophilus TaxID=325473 RepID=UPI003D65BB78
MFQNIAIFVKMKGIPKDIKTSLDLENVEKANAFITRYYSKKYGSEAKAKAVFEALRADCNSEEEFQKRFRTKVLKDMYIFQLHKLLKPFLSAKNMTMLIKNLFGFKKSKRGQQLKKEMSKIDADFKHLIQPAFEEVYAKSNHNKTQTINLIKSQFKFTLASTRKELGYPDPRTFNQWLYCFFKEDHPNEGVPKHKYSSLGEKNGYLNFDEYLEIVSAFMLTYDETTFNLSNIEDLHHRFENERYIQRKVLKQLTNNNYELLSEKLEDAADLNNLELPDKFRNVPFKIVSILKKELAEYID